MCAGGWRGKRYRTTETLKKDETTESPADRPGRAKKPIQQVDIE
jgi:hypothetical protein